jgi:hypothetical protein
MRGIQRRKMVTAIALAFSAYLSFRTILKSLNPYSIVGSGDERNVFASQEATATKTEVEGNPNHHPRVAFLLSDVTTNDNSTRMIPSKQQPRVKYPMTNDNNENPSNKSNSSMGGYREFERHWFEDCRPIADFPIHPTCNSIHEVDFFASPQISLLNMEGSWRSVWKLEEGHSLERNTSLSASPSLIFKALHTHRDYNSESFAAHAMDGMVMERLQASPYIVSSFGFCGQSVITEFAKSSGRDLLKISNLGWMGRIRLARHLARGLAELHALQPLNFDDTTTSPPQQPLYFAHHDINIANIVSLNPPHSVQWNDFNLGIMIRQDGNTNIHSRSDAPTCDVPIRYYGPSWRSPEEVRNETGSIHFVHASDVYSLGNILFTILTKQQPWSHLEEPEKPPDRVVRALKRNGTLPKLPTNFLEPPEARVLWEAAKACFRFHPEQRPTALELAVALGKANNLFRSEGRKPTTEEIEALFAARIKEW